MVGLGEGTGLAADAPVVVGFGRGMLVGVVEGVERGAGVFVVVGGGDGALVREGVAVYVSVRVGVWEGVGARVSVVADVGEGVVSWVGECTGVGGLSKPKVQAVNSIGMSRTDRATHHKVKFRCFEDC